ncbi:hypothetical protein RND71_005971 [Anisodus tanguticus]|uniref:AIG1-type G domain-containing protein n=1 Tax=Anisodus tanguticus TaxID=243964 RepID=A0AAE1VVD5_9SOLA|nr:hypothetical protein RND71_005971 [Anisodus tanguticus]
MCGNRQVIFDNKTKDQMKKAEQLRELLFHVNMVVQKNGGKPYTNDVIEEVKVTELKEQLQRWSFEEQHKGITETVKSKLKEPLHSLEKQLEKERAARLEAERKICELRDSLEKTQRETEVGLT